MNVITHECENYQVDVNAHVFAFCILIYLFCILISLILHINYFLHNHIFAFHLFAAISTDKLRRAFAHVLVDPVHTRGFILAGFC